MSKKSNRFKGYLLIEALFSLGILGMITGIYMTVNLSLLNKNRQLLDQLSLYRVLFEELQLYDLTAGNITKDRMINDKEVKINFSKNEKELIKVEILNEKDHFLLVPKNKQMNNNRFSGFTLMECLVSLMILSLMCLFFSTAIHHVVKVSHQLQSENERMWHIFLIQLEYELKNCRYQKLENQAMIFMNQTNHHLVQIAFKKGKIIKIDNGGYQPLLMNVKTVEFQEEGESIHLTVLFENQVMTSGKWQIK